MLQPRAEGQDVSCQNKELQDRKLDHIYAIERDPQTDRKAYAFDRIILMHRAVCELNEDEIRTDCVFLQKKIRMPLLISSMTGGVDQSLLMINQNLAQAAQRFKVAMAVGSMRAMLKDDRAKASFDLRKWAPDIPLLANLGAAQFAQGLCIDDVKKCIDILQADALIVHFNPLQEAVQPEGDRTFKGVLSALERLIPQIEIPVIAKEVGCGMSTEDFRVLWDIGVKIVDVAGRGGTSWSRIEYHRRKDDRDDLGLVFQDWGIPTPESLLMGKTCGYPLELIASGGVRNGIDMAKAFAMGAKMVGVAKPLLEAAKQGADQVYTLIEAYERQLRTAMFLTGQKELNDLIGNENLWFYGAGDRT